MKRPALPLRFPAPGAGVWRGLFAVILLAVLVLSLLPASVPLPTTGWDKSNHLLAFAVLGWLGRWSWPCRTPTVLGGLLLYGAFIELLQSLTPDRVAELADLVADVFGLILGMALSLFIVARR
ncbi:VanZ family protein [Variovorax sp. Varisp36]|uniref:VanZ family protein n=1 Tax=Variovorax sp. Varisp36 TaxID=3243031 RepID=UPI0039A6EA7D